MLSFFIKNVCRTTFDAGSCFPKAKINTHAFVQGSKPPLAKYARQYFYYVDEHGQLFLHDVKVKNFTSCLKEKTFLNFFTSRLRRNDTGLYDSVFQYTSPCGKELNFIEAADRAIVFTALQNDQLIYGGALSCQFEPSAMAVGQNGWLYHKSPRPDVDEWGLLAAQLADVVGHHIETDERGNPILVWNNEKKPLAIISTN